MRFVKSGYLPFDAAVPEADSVKPASRKRAVLKAVFFFALDEARTSRNVQNLTKLALTR